MAKYCTRHGFKLPDDIGVCNGCGNKCDFTNKKDQNKYTGIIVGVAMILIAIIAVVLTS